MNASIQQKARRSTAMLLSISLGGIAVAALVATAVAMMVADTLRGDAYAINLAGSMRMQSYRMLTARLNNESPAELNHRISAYQEKLDDPLLERMAAFSSDALLRQQLTLLESDWRDQLRPALEDPAYNSADLVPIVEGYVTRIDQAVQMLQQQSENKVNTLRNVQTFSLLILFSLSALLLLAVNFKWVAPLKEFMAAVKRLQNGDFSTRIQYSNNDELGLLGETINQMADQLAALYNQLEQRVKDKTLQLQRSNESLGLLYENSRLLFANPDELYNNLPAVLKELQRVTQLGTISLCLRQKATGPSYKLLTSGNTAKPSFCRMPHCDECRKEPDKTIFAPHLKEVVMFPVISGDVHVGDISVELHHDQNISPWQNNLLNAMAEVIATTQSLSKLSHQHSRLALMEERAAIARELHDSLAQSLSYQKMQASRLRKLLEKSASDEELFDAIAQSQAGLNESYKQLRELISTFRISVSEPGFEDAVSKAVTEITQQQNLPIELDYDIGHCPLSANEETHCLHIIREALNNVAKHAQAKRARVQLKQLPSGYIQLQVEDDGIGIAENPHKQNHFGLSILAERSSHLHGNLVITRPEHGGTLIDVTFEPKFLNNTRMKPNDVTEVSLDRVGG